MAGLDQRVMRSCAGSGLSSALTGLIWAVTHAIIQWRRTTYQGGWGRVPVKKRIERNCHSFSTAVVMFPYSFI